MNHRNLIVGRLVFRSILAGVMLMTAASAATPAFDVASIRVNNNPGRPNPAIQYTPDTLTMRQVSLARCLTWAYGLENFQISGPDSMQAAPFFDIVAKAPGPASEIQLRSMLRTLLSDRFHLTVHIENREVAVWALLVARGGPKLRASDGQFDPARGSEMRMQFLGYSSDVHVQRNRSPDGRLTDSFSNVTLPFFARVIALFASLTPNDKVPVLDMTGIEGRYDLTLVHDLSPSREGAGPPTAEDSLSDLKPLLEKQMGLTLDRRKAMVDVLIVDHVDKTPTEN